jgi:hypothetical protein
MPGARTCGVPGRAARLGCSTRPHMRGVASHHVTTLAGKPEAFRTVLRHSRY